MGIEKKVLSLRLDDELIEKLKLLAEKENRSLSNFIETILKKYIKESAQKVWRLSNPVENFSSTNFIKTWQSEHLYDIMCV